MCGKGSQQDFAHVLPTQVTCPFSLWHPLSLLPIDKQAITMRAS